MAAKIESRPHRLLSALLLLVPSAAASQDFVLEGAQGRAETIIQLFAQYPGLPVRATDAFRVPEALVAYAPVRGDVGLAFEARAAAFQNAQGINAAFTEVQGFPAELRTGYRAIATTNYSVQFRSTRDLSGAQIPFTFRIDGGELRIENFSAYTPQSASDGAYFAAEIDLADLGTWRWTGHLTKDLGTGQPVFQEYAPGNLDDFGLGVFPTLTPTLAGDVATLTLPAIEGTVMIDGGEFNGAGQRFVYDLGAFIVMRSEGAGTVPALAGITDPFALGTPNNAADDLGGAFGSAGVQFFLDGAPLAAYPLTPVPEPTTALLFAAGLGALGARRLQHRRSVQAMRLDRSLPPGQLRCAPSQRT